MICEPCATAADMTTRPSPLITADRTLATELHAECAGCTCQHRVPDLDTIRARREAMPRGGLARAVNMLADT